jgi:hypothetical protein
MNIFSTSPCPEQSAKWLVDKHCVKQILESCQLLCTAFHTQGINAPYKPTHKNHPSSIWTRQSAENFQWLISHTYGILKEYSERYKKIHKSSQVLKWCDDHYHLLGFDSNDLTPFAIAISNDSVCRALSYFDTLSATEKYKAYYFFDKNHLASWKEKNPPYWYNKDYFTN